MKKEVLEKIIKDRKVRQRLARQSHLMFFLIYFGLGKHLKYDIADFQKRMIKLTEDDSKRLIVIATFRGSAKTTIVATSYPLWAIIGIQQKKHVLILTQTMAQAQQQLKNIKIELESNPTLKADLGPFQEESTEWHSYSIVLSRYNARITVASTEKGIRGIKHGPHRPDLVILDDVEDLNSTRSLEMRDKTYAWVKGDVFPIGNNDTKYVIIGNLLHEDSLLMRLKREIEEGKLSGIYRHRALLDEKGNIAWPGKYPTMADVEAAKLAIGDEVAWQREFMLRIISNADRVVFPEWIQRYDRLPAIDLEENRYRYCIISVDQAISQRDGADYTAILSARVYQWGKEIKVFILPHPVNERLTFLETVERVKKIADGLQNAPPVKIVAEGGGYQGSLVEELRKQGYPAEEIPTHGQDKRARLTVTTPLLQGSNVFFPRKGAEELIKQLTGFPNERHDDLVDAFSMLLGEVISKNRYRRPGEGLYAGGTTITGGLYNEVW